MEEIHCVNSSIYIILEANRMSREELDVVPALSTRRQQENRTQRE